MKKFMAFILAWICVPCLASCSSAAGKKPYKNLKASEITSATVRLAPPDVTVQITKTEELADYLRDVVIYNKDQSYTEYVGQGVTFTLTMADGTQTNIMEYNPFLVIDGVGYRTEYEPCEALNKYANGLLHAENAFVLLEKPPELTVTSGESAFAARLGAYSWQSKNQDGTSTRIEADSAHPLNCKESLFLFETAKTTATLNFIKKTDRILSARCWNDAYWDNPDASSETVTIEGDEIELQPGGTIYEVKAEWNTESGYGGIAYYSFYVKASE